MTINPTLKAFVLAATTASKNKNKAEIDAETNRYRNSSRLMNEWNEKRQEVISSQRHYMVDAALQPVKEALSAAIANADSNLHEALGVASIKFYIVADKHKTFKTGANLSADQIRAADKLWQAAFVASQAAEQVARDIHQLECDEANATHNKAVANIMAQAAAVKEAADQNAAPSLEKLKKEYETKLAQVEADYQGEVLRINQQDNQARIDRINSMQRYIASAEVTLAGLLALG